MKVDWPDEGNTFPSVLAYLHHNHSFFLKTVHKQFLLHNIELNQSQQSFSLNNSKSHEFIGSQGRPFLSFIYRVDCYLRCWLCSLSKLDNCTKILFGDFKQYFFSVYTQASFSLSVHIIFHCMPHGPW